MSQVSRQARILIHQRDLRVGSLSKLAKFWQSFHTRSNQSTKNSVIPEWIPAELKRSSYLEDSRQAGKSSDPQNLASLSTLQEWTWDHYRGLNLTFFTSSAEMSRRVLLAILKPNRIIHKRADANCSSFHLRVFLGFSNPRDRGRLALYLYRMITLVKEKLIFS
jgi:hypothetical protein